MWSRLFWIETLTYVISLYIKSEISLSIAYLVTKVLLNCIVQLEQKLTGTYPVPLKKEPTFPLLFLHI